MRRMLFVGLALCLGSSAGCVVVAKNKGPLAVADFGREAVVVDGKVYIVDLRSGKVSRIDAKSLEEAGPYEGVPTSELNVVVVDD